MIEAILWDNDGVLLDTEELFFEATREALARAGIELTREFFVNFAMGNGRSVFELVEARGWSPDAVAALRAERDQAYARMLSGQSRVIDGVVETLACLRGKARMAVVTTSLRRHFDLAHGRSGLREFFELDVAREDYVNSKPHPEPYLLALTHLALAPDRCVAIEDSERGLKAAVAAGLRCIVVPNRMTRGSQFAGATAVFDDLRAVPSFLESL